MANDFRHSSNFGQVEIISYCHFTNFGHATIVIFNWASHTSLYMGKKSTMFLQFVKFTLFQLEEGHENNLYFMICLLTVRKFILFQLEEEHENNLYFMIYLLTVRKLLKLVCYQEKPILYSNRPLWLMVLS